MDAANFTDLLDDLSGTEYDQLPATNRRSRWRRARRMVRGLDRTVLDGLDAAQRVRGHLLLAGQYRTHHRFVADELRIRARARLVNAAWVPDSGLRLRVTGDLDRPGDPCFLPAVGIALSDDVRPGDGVRLAVPQDPGLFILDRLIDVTSDAAAGRVELVLRRTSRSDPDRPGWPCAERVDRTDAAPTEHRLMAAETVMEFKPVPHDPTGLRMTFDATCVIAPGPDGELPFGPGHWELTSRVLVCGWAINAPIEPGSAGDVFDRMPPAATGGSRFLTPHVEGQRQAGAVTSSRRGPAERGTSEAGSRSGRGADGGDATSSRSRPEERGTSDDGLRSEGGAKADQMLCLAVDDPGMLATCWAPSVSDFRLRRTGSNLSLSVDLPLVGYGRTDGDVLDVLLCLDPRPIAGAPAADAEPQSGTALGLPARLHTGAGRIAELSASVPEAQLRNPGRYALELTVPTGVVPLGVELRLDSGGARLAHAPMVSLLPPPDLTADPVDDPAAELLEPVTSPAEATADFALVCGSPLPPIPDALRRMAEAGRAIDAEVVLGRPPIGSPVLDLHTAPLSAMLLRRRLLERLDATDLFTAAGGRGPVFDLALRPLVELAADSVAVVDDRFCFRRGGLDIRSGDRPSRVRGDRLSMRRPDRRRNAGPLDSNRLDPGRLDPARRLIDLESALRLLATRLDLDSEDGRTDRMLARLLCVEILDRLRGRRFLDLPGSQRRAVVSTAHRLLLERFPERLTEDLPPLPRIVAALARAGQHGDLTRVAEWERTVCLSQPEPFDLDCAGGVLKVSGWLRMDGQVSAGPGVDALSDIGRRALRRLPEPVAEPGLVQEFGNGAELVLRAERDGRELALPCTTEPVDDGIVVDGHVALDGVLGGRPLPVGTWWVSIRYAVHGLARSIDLHADSGDLPTPDQLVGRIRGATTTALPIAVVVPAVEPVAGAELIRVPIPFQRNDRVLGRVLGRLAG